MAEIKAPPAPFSVTERAAHRIGEILANEAQGNLKLRISVSGGGCSGFQYGFALDDRDEDGDIAVEREGAKVVIDGMSLLYMVGCEVEARALGETLVYVERADPLSPERPDRQFVLSFSRASADDQTAASAEVLRVVDPSQWTGRNSRTDAVYRGFPSGRNGMTLSSVVTCTWYVAATSAHA